MSPILQPLEPFRKHLTIVSGLRNKPAETPEPHAYIEQGWLTAVKPFDFGKNGPDCGVSADQIAVRHVGQDTRLPSLELSVGQGSARIAWRTPTQPLPQESNPRTVFQKLFGQGDTDQERAQILTETGSILDRVQAERFQASLGVADRNVVGDYLGLRSRDRAPRADGGRRRTTPNSLYRTRHRHAERYHGVFQAHVRPYRRLAFQADIAARDHALVDP